MICWCGKTHYNVVKEVAKFEFNHKLIKRPKAKKKVGGGGKGGGVTAPQEISIGGFQVSNHKGKKKLWDLAWWDGPPPITIYNKLAPW